MSSRLRLEHCLIAIGLAYSALFEWNKLHSDMHNVLCIISLLSDSSKNEINHFPNETAKDYVDHLEELCNHEIWNI